MRSRGRAKSKEEVKVSLVPKKGCMFGGKLDNSRNETKEVKSLQHEVFTHE